MLISAWAVALFLGALALVLHIRDRRLLESLRSDTSWCDGPECLCFGAGPALSIDSGRHRRPERDTAVAHEMTREFAELDALLDLDSRPIQTRSVALSALSDLSSCSCDGYTLEDRMALGDRVCPGCQVPYAHKIDWTLS